MPVVTSFESGPLNEEQAEKVDEKFGYVQVESALKNDRTVAENVFARCAKRHFARRIGDSVKLAQEGDHIPSPLWVNSVSVTLYFDGTLPAEELEEIVESLALSVIRIGREKEILLVEPLSTKISEVSPKMFMFSVKQKWGRHG